MPNMIRVPVTLLLPLLVMHAVVMGVGVVTGLLLRLILPGLDLGFTIVAGVLSVGFSSYLVSRLLLESRVEEVSKADKAHRRTILKEMFEAVYIDTDNEIIVGIKPYAEFVPLFRQTGMVERDYSFVLENERTVQDINATERLDVSGGRDGIQRCVRRLEGYRSRPFNRMSGPI